MKASEPQFVADTLAWCNERRAERALAPLNRLPLGELEDPRSCPCGRATGLWVDCKSYSVSKEAWYAGQRVRLPSAVREFVAAFDSGDLPDYEADTP